MKRRASSVDISSVESNRTMPRRARRAMASDSESFRPLLPPPLGPSAALSVDSEVLCSRDDKSPLFALPVELFAFIVQSLDAQDLAHFDQLCRALRDRCKPIWRTRLPDTIPVGVLRLVLPCAVTTTTLTTVLTDTLPVVSVRKLVFLLRKLHLPASTQLQLFCNSSATGGVPDSTVTVNLFAARVVHFLQHCRAVQRLICELPLECEHTEPLLFSLQSSPSMSAERYREEMQLRQQASWAILSRSDVESLAPILAMPFRHLVWLWLGSASAPATEQHGLSLPLLLEHAPQLRALTLIGYHVLSGVPPEQQFTHRAYQLRELKLLRCEPFLQKHSSHQQVLAPILRHSHQLRVLVIRGSGFCPRRLDCAVLAESCSQLRVLLLEPSPHELFLTPVLQRCTLLTALMLDSSPPGDQLYALRHLQFGFFAAPVELRRPLLALESLAINAHLMPRFASALAQYAPNLRRLELQLGPLNRNALTAIALGCPQLEWLRMASYLFTDELVPALCQLQALRTLALCGPMYEVTTKNGAGVLGGMRGVMTWLRDDTLRALSAAWGERLEELRVPTLCGNEGCQPLPVIQRWLDAVGDAFPHLRRFTALLPPLLQGCVRLLRQSHSSRWRLLEEFSDRPPVFGPAANIFREHFREHPATDDEDDDEMFPTLENFWRTPTHF